MKNINLISSALVLGLALLFSGCVSDTPSAKPKPVYAAKEDLTKIEIMGFLSTDKCIEAGIFTDCYRENYICGSDDCFKKYDAGVMFQPNIVLYSHNENKTYNVDIDNLPASDVDKGIYRNDVTLIGDYDEKSNTIIAYEFKAPPPPKKSFFKGCL